MWASYVNSVTIEKSCVYTRLQQVDYIMYCNTRLNFKDGSAYFLSDNWSGEGPLLDRFQLDDCAEFMPLRVKDLYLWDRWDVIALRHFLPSHVIDFVMRYTFHF